MNQVIKLITSLRLTVWLLAVSVFLVWLGSLAQVHEGLWNAQVRWFQSLVVVRRPGDVWWVAPIFPGGHLLGGLLLINLLAAHAKRFTWSFQKFGIQLTHFGVIVLLVGQLIADKTKVESFMQFDEGEVRDYTQSHRDVELAFIQEADARRDEVISFPQAAVRDKGELRHERLPFTVRVREYGINGDLISIARVPEIAGRLKGALATLDGRFSSIEGLPAAAESDLPNAARSVVWRKALRSMGENVDTTADIVPAVDRVVKNPARAVDLMAALKSKFREEMLAAFKENGGEMAFVAENEIAGKSDVLANLKPVSDVGAGAQMQVVPRQELTGDSEINSQWALVEISDGGKRLGTWLVSMGLKPQEFEASGRKWRVTLRLERYYHPFSLQLVRAKQEVYQGTSQAKEFSSRVRIINPATGENRETDITMNNPLRYGGLTFYQHQMNQKGRGPGLAALLEALTGRPKEEFMEREKAVGERFSGLQAVENPSMLAPYTGCLLVGFGMLWQFLFHLTNFLAKAAGLPSPSFGVAHPLLPLCAALIMLPDIFLGWIAWKNGTLFALAVLAVTPFIRGVLAWQVWRGKHLVFAMVLLLIPTLLALPFALKYGDTHGMMLWPVASAQFAAFLGLAFIVFTNQPQPQPVIAKA
jgi:hypothetical protein